MGEVASQVGLFVTAYSGDLKDESLDGQRVVVGGIVTGFRTIITKTKSTMGVATLEDLQGTIEVVVFPRLYEQTLGTWAEGAILLVAGRVDHRGEEMSVLADLVMDWETAIQRGPEAFAREVAAGDRGTYRRRGVNDTARPAYTPTRTNGSGQGPITNGSNGSNGNGSERAAQTAGQVPAREPVAVSPGKPTVPLTPRGVPRVSPLRSDVVDPRQAFVEEPSAVATLPTINPAEPVSTYVDSPAIPEVAEHDEEPPLPDEARDRATNEAASPTRPNDAGPSDRTLHVRFSGLSAERLVGAMEALKGLFVDRPGGTRVILHLPSSSGGAPLPMELRRGVAYDSELLAEVSRRLGDGVVDLNLA
jgi:hypothetical protein